MKVGKLKTKQRRIDSELKTLGIASYGEFNDYPEKVLEVSQASPTGTGCLHTCIKFVKGNGFEDVALQNFILNHKGDTGGELQQKLVKDYKTFGGCAVHVNYDGTLSPTEYQHVPFEHCRLGIDADGNYNGKIAIHRDWTGRYNLKRKLPKKDEIKFFPFFNPKKSVLVAQIGEMGIEFYSGQIMYFSNTGSLSYPLSPFDSVVTDMATEESVSTVLYRNAKHNYMPAGMLINKKGIPVQAGSDGPNDEGKDTLYKDVEAWQGDEQAAKIIVIDVDQTEDPPTFIPFQIQNFDKMFDTTSKYIESNIGKVFMQPPILRGIDIGAGFGGDLMNNAYNFYNSITFEDRNIISQIFSKLLQNFAVKFTSTKIIELEYSAESVDIPTELYPDLTKNERRGLVGFEPEVDQGADKAILAIELGVGGTQSLVSIVIDPALTENQKKNIMITLFGLSEEEATKMLTK